MATIIPIYQYDDVGAASAFLCSSFGFVQHSTYEQDGTIAVAELRLGEAFIMLAVTQPDLEPGTSMIHVAIDDVEGHHAAAVAAGATIVSAPANPGYGGIEYTALDPAGNRWSFGTYAPSV
jgi:uncharacterized glyoxalase superfamily protein PhnB